MPAQNAQAVATDPSDKGLTGSHSIWRWLGGLFGAVLAVVAGVVVFSSVAMSGYLYGAIQPSTYLFKHCPPLLAEFLAWAATGLLTALVVDIVTPVLRPWLAVATVVVLEAAFAGLLMPVGATTRNPAFLSLPLGALAGIVLGVVIVWSLRRAKTRWKRLRALLLAAGAYLMVMAMADLWGWGYLAIIQRPSRAAVEQWLSAEVLARPDQVRWHPHWDFSFNTRKFSVILDGTTVHGDVDVDVETPADKSLVRSRGERTILSVPANGITVSLPQSRELNPEEAQDPRVLRETLLAAGMKPELVDRFDFRSRGPADERGFIYDLPDHFRAESHGMRYELLGNSAIPSDDWQEPRGPVISLQCTGEYLLPAP